MKTRPIHRTPPALHVAERPPVIHTLDRARWESSLRAFPEATVFHGLPWLDALESVYGGRWILSAAERGGEILALWPCLEQRRGPLRVVGSPLPAMSTTYQGPLFAPGADVPVVLDAFLRQPPLRDAAYVSCRVIDRARSVDLAPFGFSVVKRFETSWIDLDGSEQALWNGLKSECRSRIRKAKRLGIEVRIEEEPGFIDDFWQMTLETFARSGARPTHDRRLLAELWTHLHPIGAIRVFSAFHHGRRIATLMLPGDDRTLYYWGGATFDDSRSLPAGNLLHWEAIADARRRGLSGYDLVSAHGGAGRFKKSLGARVIHASTNWERTSSRLVDLAKRIYASFQRRRLRH